jgi:gamma-glutamyltranspeptidase/glutathione hydrolase
LILRTLFVVHYLIINNMRRIGFFCLALWLTVACRPTTTQQDHKSATGTIETANRGVLSKNGMVSTTHFLASEIGAQVLREGGNAVDAGVAVFFALVVVFPEAGNIGGGGFAVYRDKNGQSASLDFREKAPAKAHRDMFLDAKGQPIKMLSLRGHLASGVPGAVHGMYELHRRYGSKPWKQLLQPSIELAEKGHRLTKAAAANFNRLRAHFDSANTYKLPLSREWKEGDTIYHPDLARTFRIIADKGRAGFYEGEIAQLIEDEMKRGGGIITKEDLKNYSSVWRTPLRGKYKDYTVISMPPPSSGGVALLQLLEGASNYPLAKWGHNSSNALHLMTELERRVYADRATYLGDPDFFKVPVEMLLNPAYNRKRNAGINMNQKTNSQDIKEGKVELIESTETTHFSITDAQGNALSITTTLNSFYGSKVMVKGGGFFMNNEMDDFSVKPGVPNQFGLVGGEANAIAPHKRMLSSMTPTIVEKDGQLVMVVGSPGGSTIMTTVFQTILNVLEHNMTMKQAVAAKRLHHQWLPDEVLYERNGLPDSVLTRLKQLGHQMEPTGILGRIDAVLRLPDGTYEGASDVSRSDGAAVGGDKK